MSEMISFGAGINSVAMTVMLVNEDWRGPIVFADTGGEHPETYCYMEYFESHFLKPHGLTITRLLPGTEWHGRKAREPLEKYCLRVGIIPLLAVRWCSIRWKRTPLENWRKQHGFARTLLGMSASEPRRIRDDPVVQYPLYERDITRGECGRIIQHADLDLPIKSGCFFCPGQRIDQWKRLYFNHPDLYERATTMEDNASTRNQKWATLDSHGISLREHARRRWQDQTEMDLSQWLPCICRL